ncbi:hypothetical protein FM076_32065 [Streptomyces albus subsp. chlorinus]|uniref:hypothetical protein n=1 Tax=Streptomyces albus TaxID=1888 RepID=UPI0015701E3C|nr:hypothetical protein [Streptomyces albus]NSC25542.1 hypothetical protein [Streptomyces albus subsp. chlorinus]
MDPDVEAAAEAGDVVAMRQLGKYLFESRDSEPAEPWLLAAADAGDAEAMYVLSRVHHDRAVRASPHGTAHDSVAGAWCRRAAEAGHVEAIRSMSAWAALDEQEFWFRRAFETGDLFAACQLAGLLEENGRTAEAEHWYREAVHEPGRSGHLTRDHFAHFLMKEGRLEEAARLWRQNAEEGSSEAARQLAGVLVRLGRLKDAFLWRRRIGPLRARERAEEETRV